MPVGKRRDYCVKLTSGSILWRNRRFVREDFISQNTIANPEFDQHMDNEANVNNAESSEPNNC